MVRIAVGDSNSLGHGLARPGDSFVNIVKQEAWPDLETLALRGATVFDRATEIYAREVRPGDEAMIMLGTNDTWNFGESGLPSYRRALPALLAWLAIKTEDKLTARDPAVSYSGQWSETSVYGHGKKSDRTGATATFRMSGDVIYLGMIQKDRSIGKPMDGIAEIHVDGRLCQSHATQSGIGKSPTLKRGYGPSLVRLEDLGEGEHEIQIKVVSDGPRGMVYFDWAAPAVGAADVYVATPPDMLPRFLNDQGVPLNVAEDYQGAVRDVVEMLSMDGLGVHLVETANLLKPNHFVPDGTGVLPTEAGHQLIADAFLAKIKARN